MNQAPSTPGSSNFGKVSSDRRNGRLSLPARSPCSRAPSMECHSCGCTRDLDLRLRTFPMQWTVVFRVPSCLLAPLAPVPAVGAQLLFRESDGFYKIAQDLVFESGE